MCSLDIHIGQSKRTSIAKVILNVTLMIYSQLLGKKKTRIFPLNVLNVQIEQQIDLKKVKSKLSIHILYWVSGYSQQDIDNVEIICFDRKMYLPQNMGIHVLDWYHFYLNHPSISILDKTIRGL